MGMFELKDMLVFEKSLSGVSGWVSRKRLVISDNFYAAIFYWTIKLCILVFLAAILLISLPFWISALGFFFKRQYRHLLGFISLCSLVFVYLDIHSRWASGLLGYGWHGSDGSMNQALIGVGFVSFLLFLTKIGVGLAVGFIIDYVVNGLFKNQLEVQYNKNENVKWLLLIAIYTIPVFAALNLIKF